MKSPGYCLFILLVFLMQACNNENNTQKELQELKQKRKELSQKIKKLESKVSKPEKNTARTGELVAVDEVKIQPFSHYIHVHGMVASKNNIMVAPEISGKIDRIQVNEGQQVRKGQVLAHLDTELIRQNIEELKTQLEHARTLFQKQKNLREQNVGTEVEYLNAKNRVESLERQLETQKTQLNKAFVKAPISGYIDEIFPKNGEMVSPQQPLLRIINLKNVYVEAQVSEAYLSDIRKGDKAKVSFPMLEQSTAGSITTVGRYINPDNRTFKVQVSIPNNDELLKPNLLAVIKLNDFSKDSAVVVPSNIIQYDKKGEYVYKVASEDNKHIARKNYIKTGYVYGGNTLIEKGLKAGEKIITEGYIEINEGEQVRWQ